jgi:hypothetical protein
VAALAGIRRDDDAKGNRGRRGYWEDRELTRSTLVWSARLGKVSVDDERQRMVVAGEETTSRFDGLEASQQACIDEEVT